MHQPRLALAFAAILTLAAPAFAQPTRALVGYWENWTSNAVMPLRQVPLEYDVINVSFAVPASPGGAAMAFAPVRSLYPTNQQFVADVRAVQAQGRKVLIAIGGGGTLVTVASAADQQAFVSSMLGIISTFGFDGLDIDLELGSLALDPGDTDYRAPTSARIVYFIAAMQQLLGQLPASFLLTAAPETAHVQGGYGRYTGVWGCYLPVLHALRSRLSWVQTQHYNSGTMYGRNGVIYQPGTIDFHAAMADALLGGFTVDAFGRRIWFPPLAQGQVVMGLPASPAAAGSGYTAPAAVQTALDALLLGAQGATSYPLAQPGGYPTMRGLMTWSIQHDARNGLLFARSHRPYLDTVWLRASVSGFSWSTGGTVPFTLRAGRGNAGQSYVLVGGISGTLPGTVLPGGALLPLNLDAFSVLTLDPSLAAVFAGFSGTLDAAGDGLAQLNMPALPGLPAMALDFAYVLSPAWAFASTPLRLNALP